MARLGLATFLGSLALCGGESHAQLVGDFALDPKTYESPSGTVTLSVDPSQRPGAGPATYRCMRGHEMLWSGERPYTLWEAAVSDDGLVAGYAYAAGYEGGPDDALTIVLLAPDGTARIEERSKREGFVSDISMPDKLVRGLFLDPENDRLVVRMNPDLRDWTAPQSEVWLTYALSTGSQGPNWSANAFDANERMRWIDDARPVPSTGLVLLQRSWLDSDNDHHGVVFQLLDRDGLPVWRLDWPDDFDVEGTSEDQWRRLAEVHDIGSIQSVGPARFTLRRFAQNESVAFEVARLTGPRQGWQVRDVGHEPFEAAGVEKANEPVVAHTLELEELGTIELGSAPPQGPIRDVMTFELDGQGRPGLIRRTEQRFDFVRVDRDGGNAVEVPLPPPPEGEWWMYELAWTSGERWIVIASGLKETTNHAWWLDASTRALTPLEGFAGPRAESVVGTPDGGFVVLSSMQSDLVAFGPDGQPVFRLGDDPGDTGDGASLFAPEGITVLSDGEIVVLDNIQKTLQFFSAKGEFLRVVDLTAAWGREPNYPSGVRADPAGGLVVHDFNGEPPIVRVDSAGKPTGGFEPRYADGRRFQLRGDVQASRDGSLWTSDGNALLVLDESGVVQRVLGAAPDASALGKIGAVAVGPDDRVYAADARTGAVHVFGPSGELDHVCEPSPEDFPRGVSLTPLTVTDAGEVYLGHVHFAADGTRLGSGASGALVPDRYAQHGRSGFWLVGYNALYLVDGSDAVVRTIQRTPGDHWLRGSGEAGVAPDGSLALAMSGHFTGEGEAGIHLYSPTGDPIRSLEAPEGMVSWVAPAFDGARLAIGLAAEGVSGTVVLMDAKGSELGRFTPEGDVEYWQPFFARQGRELWLFDGERTLRRFALP